MKIGVEGLNFDSAHFTEGITEKCKNLHGHTFTVDIEVEGEINGETGMVVDFGEVKSAAKETLEDWDHKIIVPKGKRDMIEIGGPFNCQLKIIEGEPTTENIANEIAKEISKKLDRPTKVKVYEGKRNYAIGIYPE